jgi:hypothetical protein
MRYRTPRRVLARLRSRYRRYEEPLLKSVVFQYFSTIATGLLVVAVTGQFTDGFTLLSLDFFGKMILYFLFELGWTSLRRRL